MSPKSISAAKTSKSKKAKKVSEDVVATPVSVPVAEFIDIEIQLTEGDIIKRLSEKLSHFDAHLILDAAMSSAGVRRKEGFFMKSETKNLCLALIKRGGPAYHVGAGLYKEYLG